MEGIELKLLGFACVVAGLIAPTVACYGEKEAADPRDILGEDVEHGGVDGTEGVERHDGAETPEGQPDPLEQPATRDECGAAHRHLMELGTRAAMKEEPDEAKRREMEASLSSPEAKQFVDEAAQRCVADGTTKRQTECMMRARQEADVERCIGR